MRINYTRVLASAAAAAALTLAVAGSASAATVTTIRSGDGDTLRAIFYDGQNGTGDALYYYGGSACTATTGDADFSYADLRRVGWNDRIESVKDFNSCDVNICRDLNFAGGCTGYVDYGSTGKNLSSAFRNLATSFRVS